MAGLQFGQKILEGLADSMVDEGLITRDQLAVARVTHEDMGEDLGVILLKKGFVNPKVLLEFLAKSLSIPFRSLKDSTVPMDLVKKIPLHLARRYRVVPIQEEVDGSVTVAMADPTDKFALEDTQALLKAKIIPVLSLEEEILDLISRHYGLQRSDGDLAHEEVEMMSYATLGGDATGEKLQKIASGPMVVQTVNQIIAHAYRFKASDIHLEPQAGEFKIRYRIDGFLEDGQKLSKEMLLPVTSRIKILAGLDIAERRIPQDGRVRIKIGGNSLDMRVATCPTLYGEKVVIRLLNKETGISVESIGFSERERKIFSDLISKNHGIFLVTGPTGSGKSTTLFAALTRLNTPEKNVISIEDPIESEIPGVNQAQVNPKAGVTFAGALRSILRLDPDVIMVGEIRDGETAEIAVRAAITGHMVLSTLHTNTAAGAISRLHDLGVEPFLLASSVVGVLAQRLVRKICTHCRIEVEPDPIQLGPYAGSVDKTYVGQGCPECRMSGYSGRIGIFELAPITDRVRKRIITSVIDKDIEEEFRKGGVRSMMEDGIEKVNKGITTIEEVLRVTQEV